MYMSPWWNPDLMQGRESLRALLSYLNSRKTWETLLPMVLILDGNSEYDAHEWKNNLFSQKYQICYCSRCIQMPYTDQIAENTPYVRTNVWVTIWYNYHDSVWLRKERRKKKWEKTVFCIKGRVRWFLIFGILCPPKSTLRIWRDI